MDDLMDNLLYLNIFYIFNNINLLIYPLYRYLISNYYYYINLLYILFMIVGYFVNIVLLMYFVYLINLFSFFIILFLMHFFVIHQVLKILKIIII